MIYINDECIDNLDLSWDDYIDTIKNAVLCMFQGDFSQPIKPYLRYKNKKNRIIAMPAYIGGCFDFSGIKWISSFPSNIKKGLPRAHCVTVLNDANTGEPLCFINSAMLSIIRTAAVSGIVIREYVKARRITKSTIGIIGFGPIGQGHLTMLKSTFGDLISDILIYDINSVNTSFLDTNNIKVLSCWQQVYKNSNIIITCTNSDNRYINIPPPVGSLLLNVSLRDYMVSVFPYVKDAIFVDNWDEVCREDTDVEQFKLNRSLLKENTRSIIDIVCKDAFYNIASKTPIMFNPMGMAVFDIAIATVMYLEILKTKSGIILE